MWVLQSYLNGSYRRVVWQSQEGAIHDRERILQARRIKENGKWKVVHPIGWTAIHRIRSKED